MRLPFVVLMLALGCGPVVADADANGGSATSTTGRGETTTSANDDEVGTTTSSTAGDGGRGATGGMGTATGTASLCACVDVSGDEPIVTCEVEALCPSIELGCSRPDPYYGCHFVEREVSNPEALQCALEVAASGAVGFIETVEEGDYPVGHVDTLQSRYTLLGDGAALLTETSIHASGHGPRVVLALVARTVSAPTYFDACLALDSDALRLQCLRDGFVVADVPCLE